jgi:ATP/ADP translocase
VGLIFLLTVIVIPGAVVAAGVYVWLSRRRRG